MYFQEAEVRYVLEGMIPLMRHPDSLLWVDMVERDAVLHPETFPDSVQNFMRGMQILGEPFTFGPETIEGFMRSSGFRTLEVVPSDVCLNGAKDPVYDIYKFCMATSADNMARVTPLTFRQTRIDKRSRTMAKPHLDPNGSKKQTGSRKRTFPR